MKKNYDVAFMAVCSTDLNSLKLFYVEKGVSSLQVKEYFNVSTLEYIDDFEIHRSLNYIVINTKDGNIHLFSLKTHEFVFKYCLEMRIKRNIPLERLVH